DPNRLLSSLPRFSAHCHARSLLPTVVNHSTIYDENPDLHHGLLDGSGVDAMAANLRGLTEEGSRAGDFSDSDGALRPLSGDDHRRARGKKELLRHSGMLEFIDASENMATVGGLDNLKG